MSLMMVSRAFPRAPYRVRVLALLECQWGVEQQTRHPDDAVHGRADLVAHHGQELALRPARGLGHLLGLTELFLDAHALRQLFLKLSEELGLVDGQPEVPAEDSRNAMWATVKAFGGSRPR
jgi:hypothetical protein